MIFANLSLGWGIFLGAIFLVALIFIWALVTINRLRKYDQKAKIAESGIDLALTKRYDSLAKWFENAKKIAKKETEDLGKSFLFPFKFQENTTMSDKEAFQEKLCQTELGLKSLTENQADLLNSDSYREIQLEILNIEEHLQAARRFYNAAVTQLNSLISRFPQSLVADAISIDKRPFFELGKKD